MNVPAQSVWCVTVLHNGDIAAGCSDHRIYVFTNDIQRAATADRMVSTKMSFFAVVLHVT